MELKAQLNKPYTESQRIDFIITYNRQQNYEIRESEQALEAWGYTAEEIAQQEQARIQELFMTRSDFFDGTIRAFRLTEQALEAIIAQVLNTLPIDDVEKLVAINNFENALNFYRKHTLFTLLSGVDLPVGEGVTINISSEQWDKFFDETNKRNPNAYKELLPPAEEETEE